jgi:hypothetical protein
LIVSIVETPDDTPDFGEPGYQAFDALWSRLARPFEMVPTVAAVIGLPRKAVSQLLGIAVATSPEADELLATFPRTVRSLATSVQAHAERCIGSLRGPVLWSETMSARSASFGDPDLFVCATPSRAYDIDENHVLVYALSELQAAGKLALESASKGSGELVLRRARRNAAEATRFLEHPSLRSVSHKKPRARALKRTRSGKHRKWYVPALRMVERAATPLTVEEIRSWCDARTRAQHHVLMGVVNRLERSGAAPLLGEFRVDQNSLAAGPVEYRHPRFLGDRSTPSGIVIGQLLIDVPERLHDPNRRRATDQLKARGGGLQTVLVMDERDIDRAVELAIDLGQQQ